MEDEIKYGQMNFTIPHDVIELPSKGIFYKSKKSSVKVGFLNASDEDALSSGLKNNNLLVTLLRNKVYEPELKPEEMLDGDIEAILIFLRNTSFGPEYTVKLTDPLTGKLFDHTFSLEELSFKNPKVNPDNEGLFETTLPKSNAKVKLKLLTLGEKQKITKMESTYLKGRVTPTTVWTLQEQIVELNGSRDKSSIIDFIQNMPIMDSKYIKRFISENEPGVDLRLNAIAPSGENVSTMISFGVDFFRPFFDV
jgi:hypothetical protein